jgi:hypothetical protein
MEDFLDTHSFNKITVEHKVAEFELAKLKETVPTYADEIKENLSKNLARDIIKKALHSLRNIMLIATLITFSEEYGCLLKMN